MPQARRGGSQGGRVAARRRLPRLAQVFYSRPGPGAPMRGENVLSAAERGIDEVVANFIDEAARHGFAKAVERRWGRVSMKGDWMEATLELRGTAFRVVVVLKLISADLAEVSRRLAKAFHEYRMVKDFPHDRVEVAEEGLLEEAEPAEVLAGMVERLREALGRWPP